MIQTRNILIAATVFATLVCTAVQATAVTDPQTKRHAEIIGGTTGGAAVVAAGAITAARLRTKPAGATLTTRPLPPPETSALKQGEGIGDISDQPLSTAVDADGVQHLGRVSLATKEGVSPADPDLAPGTFHNTLRNANYNTGADTSADDLGVARSLNRGDYGDLFGAKAKGTTDDYGNIDTPSRRAQRIQSANEELAGQELGAEPDVGARTSGVRFGARTAFRGLENTEFDTPEKPNPYPSQKASPLEKAEQDAIKAEDDDDAILSGAENGSDSNSAAEALGEDSATIGDATGVASDAAGQAGGIVDVPGGVDGVPGDGDIGDIGDLAD